jgi:HAMP domain-containing protein
MSNLASAGLGLIVAFTPAAGYTAVVVNTLLLNDSATLTDAGKLGIAGVLVGAVTVPMVRWVLRRLEQVSDALVELKEKKHSAEMLAVKEEIAALKKLIEKPPPA